MIIDSIINDLKKKGIPVDKGQAKLTGRKAPTSRNKTKSQKKK